MVNALIDRGLSKKFTLLFPEIQLINDIMGTEKSLKRSDSHGPQSLFEAHPRVAIAFSGGVDSTYLVTAAAQYAQSVHAYTIDSAFVPRFELEGAKALTKKIGITHTLLPIDVLQNETVVQNPKDRCYFCKKAVFSTIWKAAKKDGYNLLLDGTNASDDASDRPGMKALAELDVLSPLRLCGLTKSLIRERSRA